MLSDQNVATILLGIARHTFGLKLFLLLIPYRIFLMPQTRNVRLLTCSLLLAVFASQFSQLRAEESFAVPSSVANILKKHCTDCHGDGSAEGGVRLDVLAKLGKDERLALLNKVQEQIFTNQMPQEEKLQASESDALLKWVSTELVAHNANKLEDKLRYYRYANYISHEKLFSGDIKDMPFTPARRWKINEFIYPGLVFNMFGKVDPKKTPELGKLKGIVKPFNQTPESGVKYYDTEVVQGGEFLTLLDNAKYIVGKQLLNAFEKTELFKPLPPPKGKAEGRGRDWFRPKQTEAAFEKLVLSKGNPSDADLQAAIACQFQLAFQRSPTPEEMTQYLQFMKEGIKTSGVFPTLEKMMVSVLMHPDFLYRSEFGDGQRDVYGRTKLTPREASYALSYALTDRVPDEALIQAANSGKLTTKDDYRREVLRMLNDDSLEKPRILRFFQDYFGYYNAMGIFKDDVRFGSHYNPHRASVGTYQWGVPGKVTKEADALVLSILKEDKEVLRQLLTTEKFFVHHSGNNEEMIRLANQYAKASSVIGAHYDKLKSANKPSDALKKLNIDMVESKFLDNVYEVYDPAYPDKRPLPNFFDSRNEAVSMYNLDHKTWSYQAVQPIKVENRMGMLTHPAWLVSFSGNTETDPIRRGKWIQEKLLAGVVPDVPITVEAKVPEAHHQTLRQRVASVTEEKYCWSCHQKMNPLGYPFESFDDFGRFRTDEMLEHPENIIKTEKIGSGRQVKNKPIYKTLPVSTAGALVGTGDKSLDGDVKDAFELIQRLAKSDRVRQSFVRNVFRYFMGRNEMLSDSKTLIEADKAYVESGGSFKALMVSLLTSDSFIYRK